MKHAPQDQPSSAKVAENGEQDRLEMFGAIGLTRGLAQTTANMGRVNQLEGELGKTEFGSGKIGEFDKFLPRKGFLILSGLKKRSEEPPKFKGPKAPRVDYRESVSGAPISRSDWSPMARG